MWLIYKYLSYEEHIYCYGMCKHVSGFDYWRNICMFIFFYFTFILPGNNPIEIQNKFFKGVLAKTAE